MQDQFQLLIRQGSLWRLVLLHDGPRCATARLTKRTTSCIALHCIAYLMWAAAGITRSKLYTLEIADTWARTMHPQDYPVLLEACHR